MKKKFSVPVELIMIIGIVYLLVQGYKTNRKLDELKVIRADKLEVYNEVTSEISAIEEDLANVGSLKYIEKIAREEHGMVKPKEVIFIDRDKENIKE